MPMNLRKMSFSKTESWALLRAWLLVSLMFAIAFSGLNFSLLTALPLALLTAGIGFILHELGHKFIAQSYSCSAEFRANDEALIFGLVLSIFGVVIAAPGAVVVHNATREQHGKIALFGPLMNFFLVLVFLALGAIGSGLASEIALYGVHINSLLFAFNLIPFPPFDGFAVWRWNKIAYGLTMILAIVTMVAFNA